MRDTLRSGATSFRRRARVAPPKPPPMTATLALIPLLLALAAAVVRVAANPKICRACLRVKLVAVELLLLLTDLGVAWKNHWKNSEPVQRFVHPNKLLAILALACRTFCHRDRPASVVLGLRAADLQAPVSVALSVFVRHDNRCRRRRVLPCWRS